ncbi:MAG: c-type cytochrome [Nitrospirae bacterium]|nr:c-type cytochrome [Nitrospirota bacterium]
MKRLRYKLVWTLILSTVVWSGSSWVGFPAIFRIFFVGYVLLGFLFFLILDAKAMHPPKRPILAIATFFLAASSILTLTGMLLPQYDPGIEIEKIRRIQHMTIEQEKEKEKTAITEAVEAAKKELLAELEKEGMTRATKKIPPGGTAPAENVAKQIALGKQVYKDYECYNCHKVGGKGGVKRRGPALDNIGNLLTAGQLKDKLWDPMTWYAEGFENEYKKVVMPENYPKLMSEMERDALVTYLMTLKDPAGNTPRPIFPPKKNGD